MCSSVPVLLLWTRAHKLCVEVWFFSLRSVSLESLSFPAISVSSSEEPGCSELLQGLSQRSAVRVLSLESCVLVFRGTESDSFMYLYILYLYTGQRTRSGHGADSKLLSSPFNCRSLSAEFPSARLASWVRTFLSGHRFSQRGGWCPQVQARAVD